MTTRDDFEKHNMIHSRSKNASTQLVAFPPFAVNDFSSSIRSIDVPNEHAKIKLHIRRVCSPPPLIRASPETRSIHSTTNLFFPSHHDHLSSPMRSIPRQLSFSNTDLQQNDSFNHSTALGIPRRMTATRRLSLADNEHSFRSAFIDHPMNIPDENTLEKATVRSMTNKRQVSSEQKEIKRQKLTTTKTVKTPTSSSSKSGRESQAIARSFFF